MFKQFLMRQAIKHAMKGVPQEQQELLLKLVEANPELFKKIADETQELIKNGKPQYTLRWML
jgi:hypothetical protein